MAQLVLKNVYKRFDNDKKKKTKSVNKYAVNNLSFACEHGEFIGILGPSGCGKTTTLRMIAGLEEITAGEICIDGKVINNVLPKDRGIGLAFEDYALYPPLNVYENVAFCLKAKKMPKEKIHEEIMRIAPLLKIDDFLDSRVASLSGGQKQRVNIARAIIRKPAVLLLDEPLSHLDGKMRQILRTEIKRLQKEIKCTTIIVTHDQLEAMSLADRIVIMNEGVLQQIGTPNEVYNYPANEFVASFIGEPPMNIFRAEIISSHGRLYFYVNNTDLKIKVPEEYKGVLKEGETVKLGIRPSDISVGSTEDEGPVMEVAVFENLGDERRISFRVGEEFFTMITSDEINVERGSKIPLRINPTRLHIFDINTGNRIYGSTTN